MEEKMLLCERCKKSVPVSEIRYMPKGRDSSIALCGLCRLKAKKEFEKEEFKKKEKAEPEKPADSNKYVCLRCNYKFYYTPNPRKIFRCPFCGKDDKLVKDEVDLRSLIRNS